MATDSVLVEMYRVKGFLRQIEIYTNRKRNCNRNYSAFIIVCSIICAIASFFSGVHYAKWITTTSAIFVALATLFKDIVHLFSQPESELCELDNLHTFYKGYLCDLEHLYEKRFDEKSKMDESKMIEEFNKIRRKEENREERLNKLCRRIYKSEKKIINDDTINYFKIKYGNLDHEHEVK